MPINWQTGAADRCCCDGAAAAAAAAAAIGGGPGSHTSHNNQFHNDLFPFPFPFLWMFAFLFRQIMCAFSSGNGVRMHC